MSRRRMRTQAEWKVSAQMSPAPAMPNASRRSRSSFAALFVKVTASTCHGAGGSTAQSCLIRRRSSAVG